MEDNKNIILNINAALILKEVEEITLTEEAKNRIQAAILVYMDAVPGMAPSSEQNGHEAFLYGFFNIRRFAWSCFAILASPVIQRLYYYGASGGKAFPAWTSWINLHAFSRGSTRVLPRDKNLTILGNSSSGINAAGFSEGVAVKEGASSPRSRLHFAGITGAMILSGIALRHSAGSALPGDTLYPVKRVDERVSVLLARSDIVSAEAESFLLDQHLYEVEMLASGGRLTPATSQYIAANLAEDLREMEERLMTIEQHTSRTLTLAGIESQIEATIRAHMSVLDAVKDRRLASLESANPIMHLLEQEKEKIARSLRSRSEREKQLIAKTGTDMQTAAETEISAVSGKVNGLHTVVADYTDLQNKEVLSYLFNRLEDLNGKVAKAKVKLKEEAYGETLLTLKQAYGIAQEIKIFIRANKTLGVPMDTLVKQSVH